MVGPMCGCAAGLGKQMLSILEIYQKAFSGNCVVCFGMFMLKSFSLKPTRPEENEKIKFIIIYV